MEAYTNIQNEKKVISCLMRDVSLLDEYKLDEKDFNYKLTKNLYECINEMKNDGYTTLVKQVTYGYALDKEIGDYIKKYDGAFKTTDNDISDVLNVMLDIGEMQNYPTYYKELKKLSCLRKLKRAGYDMSYYDEEDVEGKLHIEEDSIDDIISKYQNPIDKIKIDYKSKTGLTFCAPQNLPGADVPDEWLIDDIIKIGTFNELIAPAKAGKSQLAYQIAYEVQNGKKVLGMFDCIQCDVGYVDYEMRNNAIARRFSMLNEFEADEKHMDVGVLGMSMHYDVELADVLRMIVKAHEQNENLKLVFFDNFYSLVNVECDTNAMRDSKAILDQIKRTLTPLGITVILVNHTNKSVALESVGEKKKDISFNSIVNAAFGSMSHGAILDTAIYIERLVDGRRIHIAGRDCNEPIRISCRFDANTNYFFEPIGDDDVKQINRMTQEQIDFVEEWLNGEKKSKKGLDKATKTKLDVVLTPEMLRAANFNVFRDNGATYVQSRNGFSK